MRGPQSNSFGKEVFEGTKQALIRHQLKTHPGATVEKDGSNAKVAAARISEEQPESVAIGLAGKPAVEFVKEVKALRRGFRSTRYP